MAEDLLDMGTTAGPARATAASAVDLTTHTPEGITESSGINHRDNVAFMVDYFKD